MKAIEDRLIYAQILDPPLPGYRRIRYGLSLQDIETPQS